MNSIGIGRSRCRLCCSNLVETTPLSGEKCLPFEKPLCIVCPPSSTSGGTYRVVRLTVRGRLLMRQNGTVKFFNQAKGYGFISPADGSKDVFVHITAVQRSGIPELSENMKISFEIQPDKKGRGPQAVDLQLI